MAPLISLKFYISCMFTLKAPHSLLGEGRKYVWSFEINVTVLPQVSRHSAPGATAEVITNDVMYQTFTPLLPDLQPFVMEPWGEYDVPGHWL